MIGERVQHKDGATGRVCALRFDGGISVEWDDGTFSELAPDEFELDLVQIGEVADDRSS